MPDKNNRGLGADWTIATCLSSFYARVFVYAVFALSTPHIGLAAVFNVSSGDTKALIDAIEASNINGEDNTIVLEAGLYTLTEVNNTSDGPNGLPSVASVIEIIGQGSDTTIIERDAGADSFRILHVADIGVLKLEAITVTGGLIECCDSGGGIFNKGKVYIHKSAVSHNSAEFEGGGIAGDGHLIVNNSVISNNTAQDGGGIFRGNIKIKNSTVSDNSAEGFGGGINGNATITDSVISGNSAGFLGGGIFGTVVMNNSLVMDNASEFRGGGIGVADTSEITHSTITGNFASFSGGAIANSGFLAISNSSISGNSSGFGAIISNGHALDIINSTIAHNDGAGIENNSDEGVVTLINSTISHNTFGIENDPEFPGIVELRNTILAHNDVADCSGPVTSLGNNLIGDTAGCDFANGPDDVFGAPGLDAFTDDGTAGHGHFPLLGSSPAINGGNEEICSNLPILDTDQIGQQRIGVCDIGAVEFPQNIRNLNEFVQVKARPNTFKVPRNKNGCATGYSHKYSFRAQLTNISGHRLSKIEVLVKGAAHHNALIQASGDGIKISVLNKNGYTDGILDPGEKARVRFEICLMSDNHVALDLLKAGRGKADLMSLVDITGTAQDF